MDEQRSFLRSRKLQYNQSNINLPNTGRMKSTRLKHLQSEPLIVDRIDFNNPSKYKHVVIEYNKEFLEEKRKAWIDNNPVWILNSVERHINYNPFITFAIVIIMALIAIIFLLLIYPKL